MVRSLQPNQAENVLNHMKSRGFYQVTGSSSAGRAMEYFGAYPPVAVIVKFQEELDDVFRKFLYTVAQTGCILFLINNYSFHRPQHHVMDKNILDLMLNGK